ncbi:MAG: UDP-N-acetylmuramoyl-L-alanyl-D-glutamate--2,6-diaminopimelate ligase [Proteobacteria bacterium]|nr:UDP-N-acetylmuramoyl-L-alanyl-D-glutamate--2,6-diaminopimelate ligase [Pseudomonadota bacterium]
MMTADVKMHALLKGMFSEQASSPDVSVTHITLDSRQVLPDSLFLLLAKDAEQRLQYLNQAIKQGAIAVAFDSQQLLSDEEQNVCQQHKLTSYPVNNLSDNVGEIAARFYGHPSKNLTVIAITGTNGKTSVSQFIAQAFESLNIPCGVIGTLGVGRVNQLKFTGMTTPDPVTLQAMLADFKTQAINHVVIEASSHALAQGRLNSVDIDIAVLTNLSRDHLDYHQSMDSYAAAKQRLFEFASIKHAVINLADDFGKSVAEEVDRTSVQLLTYSSEALSPPHHEMHIQAVAINTKPEGISFKLQSKFESVDVNSSLLGRFNIDNLLAAILALHASGIEFKQTIEAITHCHAVEGRMDVYGGGNQVQVVIDFAHTPDALTQALSSLRTHLTKEGQLWCVFGCGGDRDKGKRALMGASAERNADKLVITADNPRSESNVMIVNDIVAGIKHVNEIHIEHDRQKAISYAINAATINDIVLVAGKGHEKYQEIAGIRHPFNDALAVTKVLSAANDGHHFDVGAEQ